MKTKYLTLLFCGAFAVGAQAAGESAVSKTDVLGRHVSSVRNTPKAYIKDVKKSSNSKTDLIKTRTLAKKSWEVDRIPVEASFEVSNGNKSYKINKKDYSEAQFFNLMTQIEDLDDVRDRFMRYASNNFPEKSLDNYYYAGVSGSNRCAGKDRCYINGYEFLDRTQILKKSSLFNYTYNSGYFGNGIGISFTEEGLPESRIFGNQLRLKADCNDKINVDGIIRATKVARVMNQVAPFATIYGYSTNCADEESFYSHWGDVVLPIASYGADKIHIGSNSYGDRGEVYAPKSSYMDDFIYYTRTIEFASAGDYGLYSGNSQMTDFARGVNVITVGAVRNNMTYNPTSSWKNPKFAKKTGIPNSGKNYIKPEIANFADILFPDEKHLLIGNLEVDSYYSQTVSASPYTAAMTALLLERYPFYQWHPEVVKALLIAASVNPINNGETHDSDNLRDGIGAGTAMGVPDGEALFENTRSRFWNGNNGDFFDSNNEIVFEEKNIKPNRKYRIAISWLSSGEYVYETGRLPQDIDLYVDNKDGLRLAQSGSMGPFEVVEFTTGENVKKLKITIKRDRNDGGYVLLGYSLVEVPLKYSK